uniref:Uncharacterized protein n=1 Tax=Anguilla anguilla TaxID=7936 RepID=A0A0E9T5N0_ANGAN
MTSRIPMMNSTTAKIRPPIRRDS